MKALSIRQPWASLIMEGIKDLECRNWPPPDAVMGKKFLIHASKTIDKYVIELIGRANGKEATYYMNQPVGAFLGVACLRGYKEYKTEEDFFQDELRHICARGEFSATRFAFCINVLEVFKKPIPYPGKLGFFDVPEEVLRP